jgi:hypothetical protein
MKHLLTRAETHPTRVLHMLLECGTYMIEQMVIATANQDNDGCNVQCGEIHAVTRY